MTKPCHFHQAGHCRSGHNCKFSHSSYNDVQSPMASTSTPRKKPPKKPNPPKQPTPPKQSTSPQTINPSQPITPLPTNTSRAISTSQTVNPSRNQHPPRDVCRWYWTIGECKREFDCKQKHIHPDSNPEAKPQQPSVKVAGKIAIAPFLTEQGLAKIGGIATDAFFEVDPSTSLSPADAHNRFKRFLVDTFRFQTSFDVYAFLLSLSSANNNNALWTQEEGQLLLTTITSPNGSLRVTEIINWPQISIRAGSSKVIVSFQRGILPLLRYLSSEFVVKSTLATLTHHLFSIVLQNLEKFADAIEQCMNAAISARTFKDTKSSSPYTPIDVQVFVSIAGVLHEFLVRFKNAVAAYPRLGPLVNNLSRWFQDWQVGIEATPPLFDNPFSNTTPAAREHVIDAARERIRRLVNIVQRDEPRIIKSDPQQMRRAAADLADHFAPALHSTYEGPGHLRPDGPRHDNDFEHISEIRIAPTDKELMSRIPPFLAANFFAAPHPHPADSMQRLLDIQFRLLREELTAPLRQAIHRVHDDLKSKSLNKTKLGDLLQKQGGKYRGQADNQDALMFNVYSGVHFVSLEPDWKGISASILIDTPPGQARSDLSAERAVFWEKMSGKRLFQGGLIALIWDSGENVSVHLGIVVSSSSDLSDYAKRDKDHVKIRIVFFDSSLELRILQELREIRKSTKGVKVLVESQVLFEAIRPFLEALKTEPEDLPFPRYLVLQPPERLATCVLKAPRYARLPGFRFHLDSLFPEEAGIKGLSLSVTDPASIDHARQVLRTQSRLDPSQADSVVDTLTREVALIQGPPGTGKSFTGVEIIRVLKANKIGPILLIAFTNHALDHILLSVLDANITQRVVRLGRGANDERIMKYSIETLEMAQNHSRLDRAFSTCRRELKEVQEKIRQLMRRVLDLDFNRNTDKIMRYLSTSYPGHYKHLSDPPPWVLNVKAFVLDDEDGAREWQTAGRKGKAQILDRSTYAFWRNCSDFAFINQMGNKSSELWRSPTAIHALRKAFGVLEAQEMKGNGSSGDHATSDTESTVEEMEAQQRWKGEQFHHVSLSLDAPLANIGTEHANTTGPEDISSITQFFETLGFDQTPSIPDSARPLEVLLGGVGDVWQMSASERRRIHTFWVEQARIQLGEMYMEEFKRLRARHSHKLQERNEGREEVRRVLLKDMDIIGCTTTGAAQLTSLLKGLSPKVLLVEEAGQVMEAHILGSLVPSIEHLILIGDPLQLRPTLNNYSLSVESKKGQIYKFDMSLMERLSTSGLPMSQIDVQRRMRPVISSLIRNTLYPNLEDHKLVEQYPDVRGIQENVFFVSHNHRENEGGVRGDDMASKFNTYEVAMIRDLVLYLLRQGCYTNEGDIVVLCAYLGQLARLRDALSRDVAVSIGERDQAALADQESEQDQVVGGVVIERVNVAMRVRLRTVDNYQGEEGRIVILSLVRNSGNPDDENFGHSQRANIGFLKSENRTNVALSRAREGMYIFGHAQNLSSRSGMWAKIVEELEEKGLVGPALAIACHQHPDQVKYISEPGQLPQIAPDGGCLQPCAIRLDCGHLCPFKCHSDDPKHVAVTCPQPCRRLCARDHPCRKKCREECGKCQFPIASVQLPCGHVKASVPCWQMDSLEGVYCGVKMKKDLLRCEHTAVMPCGREPPSNYSCLARCDQLMGCCSKKCQSRCHDCQGQNPAWGNAKVSRIQHQPHPCEKRLHCGHQCREKCSNDHEHTKSCKEKCRQSCKHAQCRLPCSEPCAPCQKPCGWNCNHYSCPVPCGSVCVRLPCDKPCKKPLRCGHPCPSVCGEDCDIQACRKCASTNQKNQVVDLILHRSLKQVLPESGFINEMIITIPACRHVFTVETLDGHTGLKAFYSRDQLDTEWTGLLAPTGFINPPTCPTCQSPITCPRYGRIVKRAGLDILERNVAAHLSLFLNDRQRVLESVNGDTLRTLLAAEAATIKLPDLKDTPQLDKQKNSRNKVLASGKAPTSERDVRASNATLYFVHPEVLSIWQKVTQPLFAVYKDIVKIMGTRYAHSQTWETSLSLLVEREIQAELDNPATPPGNPREHAMRMAKIYIGQPRPLADQRFLVEAFWTTLHIRLTLINLGQTWVAEVKKRQDHYSPFHLQQWVIYVDFLLQTCVRDAGRAYDIARDSESHRQTIKSRLLRMRVDLEVFRFKLSICQLNGTIKGNREELFEEVERLGDGAKEQKKDAINTHFERKVILSSEEESVWVKDNFTSIAETIISEWMEMRRSIIMETSYQPVSLDERMQIVRARDSASTGDFYQCADGHIFVITECGGTVERRTCPECGSAIGGESRGLDGLNSRSQD